VATAGNSHPRWPDGQRRQPDQRSDARDEAQHSAETDTHRQKCCRDRAGPKGALAIPHPRCGLSPMAGNPGPARGGWRATGYRMATWHPTARRTPTASRPGHTGCGRTELRDLPARHHGAQPLRRRPAPLFDQSAVGEPAPPRGRAAGARRRHRGGRRVGPATRGARRRCGRRRRRDRLLPRARAHAGLHRRPRRGRSGCHARRAGHARW